MKPEYNKCLERELVLHLVSDYIVSHTIKDTAVFVNDEVV